jgi:hypothetical protein
MVALAMRSTSVAAKTCFMKLMNLSVSRTVKQGVIVRYLSGFDLTAIAALSLHIEINAKLAG